MSLEEERNLEDRACESFDSVNDPLEFWNQGSAKYPSLSRAAQSFLAIPASEVECERVFSLAGLIYNKLRSRLSRNISQQR